MRSSFDVRPSAAPALVGVAGALESEAVRVLEGIGPNAVCNAPAAPTPRLPDRKSRLVNDFDMKGSDQFMRNSGETRASTKSSWGLPLAAIFQSAW